MSDRPKFFDDLAGVAGGAISALAGLRDEAEGERVRLRGCLGGLSRIQRESIHLAFFDGLTHAQISAKLQVPLGTAKARLREGLGKLKSCMGAGVDGGTGARA